MIKSKIIVIEKDGQGYQLGFNREGIILLAPVLQEFEETIKKKNNEFDILKIVFLVLKESLKLYHSNLDSEEVDELIEYIFEEYEVLEKDGIFETLIKNISESVQNSFFVQEGKKKKAFKVI